ncbi:hypothetical protein LRS03_23775 [Rhizobacter sp. J219]|uniref:hypothetical protein n=1 Tax=Rhizobacter sp. J219 TaxID=2898430 RepID=UPI0021511828|nr:hypothetical protein [Rhizobacter sp. J219]MCR5885713.1 hypothetical protein [Rhizobacter sp. J219]
MFEDDFRFNNIYSLAYLPHHLGDADKFTCGRCRWPSRGLWVNAPRRPDSSNSGKHH